LTSSGLRQGCTAAETNLEKTNATIADKQKELEQTQGKQADDARDIARQQKGTERYHAKRQMLTARKEECNNNIRDLGALPEEAFEKYINVNSDKVGFPSLSQGRVLIILDSSSKICTRSTKP